MNNIVYIGLGSNKGRREDLLKNACDELGRRVGVILKVSSLYETAAWGLESQADFLNQVVKLATVLSPEEVLYGLQQIEKKAGRTREQHWGPRTLDLDVLFYNDLLSDNQCITLPHPRIQERNFVLIPLLEIAPDFIHPRLQKSIRQLLEESTDSLPVRMWINP